MRIKPKGGSTGRQHQYHLGSLRTTAPGPHPRTIARDFPGNSWCRIRLRNTGLDYFWVLPANELLTLCCCSVAKSCLTLCDLMNCSMPGFPIHHQLPELAQTHGRWWVSDAIQPSHPLPRLFLPSIIPSIRVFSNESALHIRWPKYWSFSFSISPSNEYSGLISFRIDWFDILEVQGTLKSLLQHHNSKASILQHSAIFMVQLSHLCMMTGKTIALTRETFVDKVVSAF